MQKYLGSFRSGFPEKGFRNYVGGGAATRVDTGREAEETVQMCSRRVGTGKVSADPAGSSGAAAALQKRPEPA